jgi:hypothetical protein
MKKIIITLLSVLLCITGHAQFFEKVDYVGALSADKSKDWTSGWTHWNPKTIFWAADYGWDTTSFNSPTGIVEITGTVTLVAKRTYLLRSVIDYPCWNYNQRYCEFEYDTKTICNNRS